MAKTDPPGSRAERARWAADLAAKVVLGLLVSAAVARVLAKQGASALGLVSIGAIVALAPALLAARGLSLRATRLELEDVLAGSRPVDERSLLVLAGHMREEARQFDRIGGVVARREGVFAAIALGILAAPLWANGGLHRSPLTSFLLLGFGLLAGAFLVSRLVGVAFRARGTRPLDAVRSLPRDHPVVVALLDRAPVLARWALRSSRGSPPSSVDPRKSGNALGLLVLVAGASVVAFGVNPVFFRFACQAGTDEARSALRTLAALERAKAEAPDGSGAPVPPSSPPATRHYHLSVQRSEGGFVARAEGLDGWVRGDVWELSDADDAPRHVVDACR